MRNADTLNSFQRGETTFALIDSGKGFFVLLKKKKIQVQ